MLRGPAVVLSEYNLFPVPPLLRHAGLIFCFLCSASIHLKGGKPPATNRTVQTNVKLGSASRLLAPYTCMQGRRARTHSLISAARAVSTFTDAPLLKRRRGFTAWQLALEISAVPDGHLRYPSFNCENTSSASFHLHSPLCQESFIRADNELCSLDEERNKWRTRAEASDGESRVARRRGI